MPRGSFRDSRHGPIVQVQLRVYSAAGLMTFRTLRSPPCRSWHAKTQQVLSFGDASLAGADCQGVRPPARTVLRILIRPVQSVTDGTPVMPEPSDNNVTLRRLDYSPGLLPGPAAQITDL